MISPAAALSTSRAKVPFLDHLVRTLQRYQADAGDRLAAAVTFYWFLSLFPMLLVAIYAVRLINGDNAVADVQAALAGYLPQQLVETIGEVIGDNAGKAGLIGAVGLLLAGLGWINALREAIRTVWHQNVQHGNFVTRRLMDSLVLVGLLATVAASVTVTTFIGLGSSFVLDLLGIDESSALMKALLQVLGLLLAGLADVALFSYLFVRLAKVPTPIREVLKAAVFGAVGFAALKLVGGFYVTRTTSKGEATYGVFAVVVGLLLFLNLVSRLILLAAAFAVTEPYDSDVRPSGTADADQALRAGIPVRYAGTDLNLQEDGAPSPLRAAVQGKAVPQEVPTGRASWSEPAVVPVAPPPAAVPEAAVEPEGAAKARLAGRLAAAGGGAVLVSVGVYGAKTLRRIVRRKD